MFTIHCPFCRARLGIPDKLRGTTKRCPECQATILLGGSAGGQAPEGSTSASQPDFTPFDFGGFSPPPPPPPDFGGEDFGSLEPSQVPVGPAFRNRLSKPATSIWDIFDWRLEKYVTPVLLRFYWLMAVVMAFVCIGIFSLSFVFNTVSISISAIGVKPSARSNSNSASSASGSQRSSEVRSPFQEGSVPDQMKDELIFFALKLYLVVSTVFAVRIGIESLIVLFNIALHVRQIERNTRPQMTGPPPVGG